MSNRLSRRLVLLQTLYVGATTLTSQCLGLVREVLLARFFGVSAISDAFFTAYRIPNSLRKIFAEGALSAAFVPTLVGVVHHDGKLQASRVTTLALMIIEGALLIICLVMYWAAPSIIGCISPGWTGDQAAERAIMAINFLHVLVFFIVFVSTSALLASALQSVNYFSALAIGQIITNLLLIGQLWLCQSYDLSANAYMWFIMANGVFVVFFNLFLYFRKGMTLARPNRAAWESVQKGLRKFVPCLVGFGAIEINLMIDQAIASYLPIGCVSLLQYTYAFARIPLRGFAGVFSMVLLPQFARISTNAPKRLSFYFYESAKLIFWVTVPASILLAAFSYKLFYTFMLSKKFTEVHVYQAHILLSLFSIAVFFLALEKIILNIFYAMHETKLPTRVTLISTGFNTVLNIVLMYEWGVYGLIFATVLATIGKFFVFVEILRRKFGFTIYYQRFGLFAVRYSAQLALAGVALYGCYAGMHAMITGFSPELAHGLLWTKMYWLWVCPLCGFFAFLVYITRGWFGVRLHFLD